MRSGVEAVVASHQRECAALVLAGDTAAAVAAAVAAVAPGLRTEGLGEGSRRRPCRRVQVWHLVEASWARAKKGDIAIGLDTSAKTGLFL